MKMFYNYSNKWNKHDTWQKSWASVSANANANSSGKWRIFSSCSNSALTINDRIFHFLFDESTESTCYIKGHDISSIKPKSLWCHHRKKYISRFVLYSLKRYPIRLVQSFEKVRNHPKSLNPFLLRWPIELFLLHGDLQQSPDGRTERHKKNHCLLAELARTIVFHEIPVLIDRGYVPLQLATENNIER